jgi:hypothetical protein
VATMKMESKERAFIVLPIAWGTVGTVESTWEGGIRQTFGPYNLAKFRSISAKPFPPIRARRALQKEPKFSYKINF